MGKPKTLLEGLCGHALSFGGDSISVEHKDGVDLVFAHIDGTKTRIYRTSGAEAEELRQNLQAAAKRPIRSVVAGNVFLLQVRTSEGPGEGAFEVGIELAPAPDPSTKPSFTAKQGQYLAYIHHYSKIHRQSPAESDLQRYFRVSPPSVHEMIKTLERNGHIRRTPGKARSIELLVDPEYIPKLG
jgi:repressor LexA